MHLEEEENGGRDRNGKREVDDRKWRSMAEQEVVGMMGLGGSGGWMRGNKVVKRSRSGDWMRGSGV